jgi:adenosylcobinamide-phosphate synthase
MLLVPAVVIWVLQGLLESLGGIGSLLLLALHAVVLYLTVPMGRLVRRLDRLGLLAAAGERAAMREMVSRWSVEDRRGAVATHASGAAPRAVTPLKGSLSGSLVAARSTFALPVLDAYRDVFAPLFWYVLLGPAAPVAYGFARLAAERRTGVARRALYWIDWVPSRLAAASLAFAGRFDDAMLGLRAGHDASRVRPIDSPGKRRQAQALQLLLLPAAGGALGIRLTDPAVEEALRDASPDHDPPEAAPTPAGFPALRALLGRTAMIWGGLWLLVHLVG